MVVMYAFSGGFGKEEIFGGVSLELFPFSELQYLHQVELFKAI